MPWPSLPKAEHGYAKASDIPLPSFVIFLHNRMKTRLTTLLIILCACALTHAQGANVPTSDSTEPLASVRRSLYSDNMVLQRDAVLRFRGQATPGERVHVALAGINAEVRADRNGHWQVQLPPLPAGGPYTLQMGRDTYHNVYLGEVWLCSGQSNMEFKLNNDAEFRRHAAFSDPNGPAPDGGDFLAKGTADTRLHLFNMREVLRTNPGRWPDDALASIDHYRYFNTSQGWTLCTEDEASRFSAIAYYFGRALADSLNGIHIGLILNAVGGSPTESWIDDRTLSTHHPEILRDWSYNPLVQDWVRGRAIQNVGDEGHLHPYQPVYLYKAGIEPLRGYMMRGVIWYQGESNAQDVAEHERLLPLMLQSWRRTLTSADGRLPFYMVQLSSIAPRTTWPDFRDSQRRLAERLPDTWMAICSDLGDSLDVHPRQKRPVGERLAALALNNTYHQPQTAVMPYAPTDWTLTPGTLTLRYGDHALRYTHATPLMFEVQSPNGEWIEATPTILDSKGHLQKSDKPGTLQLRFPKNITPTAVRYGWQPFTRANVTNRYGWPLSTFKLQLDATR